MITLILNTSVLHTQVLYEFDSAFYPSWDGTMSIIFWDKQYKKVSKVNRKIYMALY